MRTTDLVRMNYMPKAQAYCCDHALSVLRRLNILYLPMLYSETSEKNPTKLNMQEASIHLLYQVCVILIEKGRWPPGPLIGRDFSSGTA